MVQDTPSPGSVNGKTSIIEQVLPWWKHVDPKQRKQDRPSAHWQ